MKFEKFVMPSHVGMFILVELVIGTKFGSKVLISRDMVM